MLNDSGDGAHHMFIGPNHQTRIFNSYDMGKMWTEIQPEPWEYGGIVEAMFDINR